MLLLIDLRLLRSWDDDVSAWFSLVVVISLGFDGMLWYQEKRCLEVGNNHRLSSWSVGITMSPLIGS